MEARPRITSLGGELVAFFQADAELVTRWFEQADLPDDLAVAADEGGDLYRGLGTGRPGWLGLARAGLGPALRAHRAGFRPRPSRADMRRLGADVVIDADGEIRFLHLAANPDDRIEPGHLIEELARVRPDHREGDSDG